MGARDIVATKLPFAANIRKEWAQEILDELAAAGYVILSPDEVRGIRDEALDDAIKAALDHPGQQFTNHRGHVDWAPSSKYDVAAAIRALKGGRDAQ